MRAVSEEEDWGLDFGAVALMWRGGCIIRSRFLGNIRDAFETDPELANLMLDDFFKAAIDNAQAAWRRVVVTAVKLGIPMPAIGSALAYYDGYRSERLPANLLQAQRDYFGAHTYERIDRPRGEFFHTNWTGRGGDTHGVTARTCSSCPRCPPARRRFAGRRRSPCSRGSATSPRPRIGTEPRWRRFSKSTDSRWTSP